MPNNVIYILYWTLQVVLFPFFLLYLGARVARNGAYANRVLERFGFIPEHLHRTVPGAIWLHAVSVGEAQAAVGLIHQLRQVLPGAPVYVSVTTLAGRAMAEKKLHGAAAGVFYAPFDFRFAVRAVLRHLQPSLVIVMETEIWPNLYRESRLSGARLLVVNGRISDRALPRYARMSWFFRAALAWPDLILAQDATAEARYLQLGARRVENGGNLKYDFDPAAAAVPADLAEWLVRQGPAQVWIAASTMPPAHDGDIDEDDAVIRAFLALRAEFPGLLAILAPRRPERFEEAARKLSLAGIPFARRTALDQSPVLALPGILLLDTIGELASLFRLAAAVFVGGSLAQRGGHNLLEPAAAGVAILTGPNNQNFAEIAAGLLAAGGARLVAAPDELAAALREILSDEDLRRQTGARAAQAAAQRRGATGRAADRAVTLYEDAVPSPPLPLLRRLFVQPLTLLWRAGVSADRALRSLRWEVPGAPVISVGNLAMGGTGKTPFTIWLARALQARGYKPGVLMRGYRRSDSSRPVAFPAGATAPVSLSGEEAQLILNSGVAAVGIGADRQAAWWALSRVAPVDAVLLDDGFQHWPMRRDLDIVLIDTLDPLRGGLFPAGRLREPFPALARAGAVVLTGAEPGRSYAGLRRLIASHSSAPVFLARLRAGAPALPTGRIAAFCGLGNPESFRRTLQDLGIRPVRFQAFPDHHRYDAGEIRRLAASADALLTTAKDAANIEPALMRECRVQVVPVELTIDDPQRLLDLIARFLPAPTRPA